MKTQLTLLFTLISLFSFSQVHRFIYELKYKKDSLSDQVEKVNMVLDINENEVQFYEYKALRIDSINRLGRGFTNYSFPIAKLKRSLSSDRNTNYFFIGDSYFAFKSEDPVIWKITSETKSKENWKLQKATTHFGGRNWEAWFTTEIPFSEDPYKFKGLPGLILEIRDLKNNFNFELIKIEKPKNFNPEIVETIFNKKPLLISFEKYQQLLLAHYNDPYSRFRSMKPGTWEIGRADNTYVDTVEGLVQLTREEQQQIRTENNPIEIDKVLHFSK